MNLEGYEPGDPKAETPEDAWMLSRLAKMVATATEALETYQLGDYARDIQAFFWNEVCDWYIELCKGRLLDGTAEERLQVQRNLVYVLDVSMRLLHPVMPFVTESVWDALPASGLDAHDQQFLMVSAWPKPEELAGFVNEQAEHDFELARRVVSIVRATRARYRLSPRTELDVAVRCSADDTAVLESQRDFICNVGRVDQLALGAQQDKPAGAVSAVDGGLEVFVVVGGLVDLAAEGKRLEKEIAKAEKELAGVARTLGNPGFVAKAAPEVIEKKRSQQAELEQRLEQLRAQAADLA
jgi:valyl-tRNA synthetase